MIGPSARSEVTALRQQIEREHEAARFALTGLAEGTAKHWFINRRMHNIDRHREALAALIGEQASIQIVSDIFEDDPSQRSH